MFKKTSALVKVWLGLVLGGTYKLEEVPAVSNLKEMVTELVNETSK